MPGLGGIMPGGGTMPGLGGIMPGGGTIPKGIIPGAPGMALGIAPPGGALAEAPAVPGAPATPGAPGDIIGRGGIIIPGRGIIPISIPGGGVVTFPSSRHQQRRLQYGNPCRTSGHWPCRTASESRHSTSHASHQIEHLSVEGHKYGQRRSSLHELQPNHVPFP